MKNKKRIFVPPINSIQAEPKWIFIEDASDLFQVSINDLGKLCSYGMIRDQEIGGGKLLRTSDVLAYKLIVNMN